jgi:hypothetical protein
LHVVFHIAPEIIHDINAHNLSIHRLVILLQHFGSHVAAGSENADHRKHHAVASRQMTIPSAFCGSVERKWPPEDVVPSTSTHVHACLVILLLIDYQHHTITENNDNSESPAETTTTAPTETTSERS